MSFGERFSLEDAVGEAARRCVTIPVLGGLGVVIFSWEYREGEDARERETERAGEEDRELARGVAEREWERELGTEMT